MGTRVFHRSPESRDRQVKKKRATYWISPSCPTVVRSKLEVNLISRNPGCMATVTRNKFGDQKKTLYDFVNEGENDA